MVTVVNPSHWLDDRGELPTDLRLRARMLRVAQCIEAGGPLDRGQARETLVACRRRPEGQTCLGLLWVVKQDDDAIHAFCATCKADEYMIYEWESTLWAEGPMEPVDVAILSSEADEPKCEPGPSDLETLLERALTLIGSPLSTTEVSHIVERSSGPSAVVNAVLGSASVPPSAGSIERLLPVLMDLWNTTSRDELGGMSPTMMHQASTAAPRAHRPGRNDPCPCGSGRKFKKCCLHPAPH